MSNPRQTPQLKRPISDANPVFTGDLRLKVAMATPATQKSGSEWTEQEIGGIFPGGAPVTPVSRNPDHIDLFVVGDDEQVYSSWWATGNDWSGRRDK